MFAKSGILYNRTIVREPGHPNCRSNFERGVYQKKNPMSNVPVRFQMQFPLFPWCPERHTILCLTLCLTVFIFSVSFIDSAACAPFADREKLEDVSDDSPLARSGDKAGWDYLFDVLKRHSQEDIESRPFDTVGFTELNRQPVEYRGRLVRITGKLLRCEFVPLRREASPFAEDAETGSKHGYYESWVLVKDQKEVPIAVCSLEIPEGLPTGDGLAEPVIVSGIFYKRQLFLSAEGEEVTTPTILAKTLRWKPIPKEAKAKEEQKNEKVVRNNFLAMLFLLIVLWLVFRYMGRRLDAGHRTRKRIRFNLGKKDEEEEFDGKIRIPGFADREEETSDDREEYDTPMINDHNTTVITPKTTGLPEDNGAMIFVVFILQTALLAGAVFAQVPQYRQGPKNPINAEFTKMLLKMDDFSWDTLGDENVSLEQQWESVVEMLAGLIRTVPGSFLANGTTAALPAKDDIQSKLAKDPAQYRGKAFRLHGHVVHVEEVPLNPVEQKNCRIPRAFRCRFQLDDRNQAEILCGFVPSEWKRNEPIRERAEATGIYIKRIRGENSEKNESEKLFDETPSFIPLLVAPRIEWYPDTFLGNLDFDVGSFEQVPPLKISDLKKKELDVSSSLELLPRNEIIRRAFKFTEADDAPFYGLLKAIKFTPPGRIEQEAWSEMEKQGKKRTSVVELFNHPEKTRGTPVLLHGTAKRVMTTLVENKEIKELYGIDQYYQIYLFTDDSQGNPIVVCTTSLPEGMPTGTSPDYAERISVGAIPYKLWVYETEAKLEDGDGRKPSFAPLLIGRSPKWFPDEKKQGPAALDPNDPKSAFMFGVFVVLILVWLFFRRFKSNRKIEFNLNKKT